MILCSLGYRTSPESYVYLLNKYEGSGEKVRNATLSSYPTSRLTERRRKAEAYTETSNDENRHYCVSGHRDPR